MKLLYSNAVGQILDLTRHVTETWPSRLAGSKACQESAQYIANKLEESCDSVSIEDFQVHPGAFLGYIRMLVVLYIGVVICMWMGYFFGAFLMAVLTLVVMVAEFFIYKEFVDPLFPRKLGKNVVGILEPNRKVKQQIIVSGHHDSAHIFNFFVHQPQLYPIRVLGSILSNFLILILTALVLGWDSLGTVSPVFVTVCKYLFLGLGVFVLPMWFFYSSKGTPGAGDNMASSATAMQIAQFFREERNKGTGLEHTRIIVGSWDAEEAGLRGARAYVKAHKDELSSIPSYNFNIECLYNVDQINFLSSDINGFVKLSEDMAQECIEIASELGYETDVKPILFGAGGTDAAEFAKAQVEATTLFGMGWTPESKADAYHTLKDTLDAVDPKAVDACFNIVIHYIRKKDREVSDKT